MNPPIFILAFANEQEAGHSYLRGINKELRGLRKALEAAEGKGLVKPVFLPGATVSDLFDIFQKEGSRIMGFHFSGHANSVQLLLESDAGNQSAHSAGLMAFLARQQSLKFVFLNACSTQGQIAPLLSAGIPTIATSQSVNDDVATELSVRFYKGLGASLDLKRAFEDAQDNIRTFYGEGASRDLYWESAPAAEIKGEPWGFHVAKSEALEWSLALQQKIDKQGEQSSLKEKIRKLIAADRLKEAFAALQEAVKGSDNEDVVAQLQGKLKKLEREKNLSLISEENANMRHAQIVHAMLSMLDDLAI